MLRYTTGRGSKARVMRSSDLAMLSTKVCSSPRSRSLRGWTPFRASVTMNSARNRPTPSTGSAATSSAWSAKAMLA